MIWAKLQDVRRSAPHAALGKWLLILSLTLTSGFVAAGCGRLTTGQGQGQGRGAGPGGRPQVLALSPAEEEEVGKQAYDEILTKRKSDIVSHGSEVDRVKRVGNKIAKAAQIEPLQREINLRLQGFKFKWEFNVLKDRQINAFCLPGGKVVVFTGLLPLAANDDQLATVMAHEIAHALAHHGSERIARQKAEGGGFMGMLTGKSHDRDQESEADHIGLFLMTFAGYDPEQAVVFWQHMRTASSGGSQMPEILSDHPSDSHRIAQMGSWIAPAKAAKRAFEEGRIIPRTVKKDSASRDR